MVESLIDISDRLRARDAQQKVIDGLDGNKEDAAKSMDIAANTGQDASYIYGNYPIESKAYISGLAQDVVARNNMIQNYFNKNDLASIVSKDDIPNLVNYSRAFEGLKHHWYAWPEIAYHAAQIIKMGEEYPTESLETTREAFKAGERGFAYAVPTTATSLLAYGGAAALLGTGPLGVGVGLGAALIAGGAENYLQNWFIQKYFPAEAERIQRAEEEHPYAFLTGGILGAAPFFAPGSFAPKALLSSAKVRAIAGSVGAAISAGTQEFTKGEIDPKDTIAAFIGTALFAGKETSLGNLVMSGRFVRSHIMNGEIPPAHVWRPWDEVLVEDTKAAMDKYDEVMSAGDKTETKELSPQAWRDFLATKIPIGLKWDMVRQLYPEGKRPAPGDGLLGDVPGIQEKWDRSVFSKEDLRIPFDEWSLVDKEVEKALHDDVRARPDLYTLNETKELPPEPVPKFEPNETQQLISDTRTAAGLDPLFLDITPEGQLVFKPGVVMPKRDQERMLAAIKESNADDYAKRLEIEKKKAERQLLPEYEKRGAELHEEVSRKVEDSPEFKAWRFMNNGEYMGVEVGAKPKIDPEFLSPDQLKEFPKHWLSKDAGLSPDEIGPEMGFRNGDDFIDGMIEFRRQKGTTPYRQHLANTVRSRVKQQVEAEFGDLDNLTADMARQHVIAPREEDRVWIEYQTLADMIGAKMPYTRAQVNDMADKAFGDVTPYTDATLIHYTRELSRAGAEANKAWVKGDIQGAFIARQEATHKMALARRAKEFEQRIKGDARILRPLRSVNPKNMDPEYADFAHDIMHRTELPTARTEEHLAATLARPERPFKNIADFVNNKNLPSDPNDPAQVGLPLGYQDSGITYNPNMPIWDKLLDSNFRMPVSEMSVREYKATTNSLRVLRKLGKDVNGNIIDIPDRGEINTNDVAPKFIEPIMTFDDAMHPRSDLGKRAVWMWRTASAYTKTVETFLMRMARFDESNIWLTHFFDPANQAYNNYVADRHKFGQMLRDEFKQIRDKYGHNKRWMRKEVDNKVFFNPRYWQKDADGNDYIPDKGKALLKWTNENLVALAANMNSEKEIAHTAAGYRMTPDELRSAAVDMLRPEHYEYARALGRIFEKAQDLQDTMTMRRSGWITERQPEGMVWTPWGEQPSWYYPRKRDAELDDGRRGINPHPPPIRIAVEHGWDEQRTGANYPVQMDLAPVQHELDARLRYIHTQPVIDIFNKIVARKDVMNAIHIKFGPEYNKMLRGLVNDLAANLAPPEGLELAFNRMFNAASGRGLTNAIGYNFGTVEKHTPQSVMQSIADDPIGIMKAVIQIGTNRIIRQRNVDFMDNGGMVGNMEFKGANELKNRRRYFKDELSDAAADVVGKASLWRKFDMANARLGTIILAEMDNLMSRATWLARYNREMNTRNAELIDRSAGMSTAEFNQAMADNHVASNAMAERAVRFTHGPTGITGKPAILRTQDPFMYTMSRAYGFMNNVLQRRIRMMTQFKDLVTGKSPRDLQTDLRQITRDFMTYFFLPTFLEDLADPICKQDDEWWECGGKYLAQGIAAPLPFVRDMVHEAITGGDASMGFIWNGAKAAKSLLKVVGKSVDDEDIDYGRMAEYGMELYGLWRNTPTAKLGGFVNYLYKLGTGEERLPEDISESIEVARHGRTQPTRREEEHQRIVPRLLSQ